MGSKQAMQAKIGISHKIPGSKIVQNIHRGSLEYNILSTKDCLGKGNLVPELCAVDPFLCVACFLVGHSMGKPAVFPKRVLWVWVWFWIWHTATHCVPVLRYRGYSQVYCNKVRFIFCVLNLVFSYLWSLFFHQVHCVTVWHNQIWLCQPHAHFYFLTVTTTGLLTHPSTEVILIKLTN